MELANVAVTEGGGATSWIKDPQVRSKVDMVIKTLNSLTGPDETVDVETMQFILEAIGMDEQMLKQLKSSSVSFSDVRESDLAAYAGIGTLDRAVKDKVAYKKFIEAIDVLLDDWYAAGFTKDDIVDYMKGILPEGPNN